VRPGTRVRKRSGNLADPANRRDGWVESANRSIAGSEIANNQMALRTEEIRMDISGQLARNNVAARSRARRDCRRQRNHNWELSFQSIMRLDEREKK
jgi:hypothetical protein